VRRYAITIAVAFFFVLAGVGCLYDVPPLLCGLRALVGAVAAYVATIVVGKLIVNIMVDAMVRKPPENRELTHVNRERGSE